MAIVTVVSFDLAHSTCFRMVSDNVIKNSCLRGLDGVSFCLMLQDALVMIPLRLIFRWGVNPHSSLSSLRGVQSVLLLLSVSVIVTLRQSIKLKFEWQFTWDDVLSEFQSQKMQKDLEGWEKARGTSCAALHHIMINWVRVAIKEWTKTGRSWSFVGIDSDNIEIITTSLLIIFLWMCFLIRCWCDDASFDQMSDRNSLLIILINLSGGEESWLIFGWRREMMFGQLKKIFTGGSFGWCWWGSCRRRSEE